MRANGIRQKWAKGEAVVNGWLGIPSAFSAELMAHQGWDSLTVDCQHGLIDYQMATHMLQAISTTDTTPMVRVPWCEPGIVMKMLDAGAYGIVCPMINTREDAERLVSHGRYAPKGQRSFGPIRATVYGGSDYGAKANDEILLFAMTETAQAVENIDAIMSVDGLDGVYVGPADLSLTMGFTPGMDPTEPKVVEAIDKIIESGKKHGKHVGQHCGSPAYAKNLISKGMDWVTLLGDGRLMTAATQQILSEMGTVSTGPASSTY